MQTSPRYVSGAALLLIFGIGSMAFADSLNNVTVKQREVYQALQTNPTDEDLTIQLASLAMETGEYQLAIAHMERLVATQPAHAAVRLKLGILYYMIGDYDTARSYLEPLSVSDSHDTAISTQAEHYLARM